MRAPGQNHGPPAQEQPNFVGRLDFWGPCKSIQAVFWRVGVSPHGVCLVCFVEATPRARAPKKQRPTKVLYRLAFPIAWGFAWIHPTGARNKGADNQKRFQPLWLWRCLERVCLVRLDVLNRERAQAESRDSSIFGVCLGASTAARLRDRDGPSEWLSPLRGSLPESM